MQKRLPLLILAAVLGCAHEDPLPQPTAERDWAHGLEDQAGPNIAPLGPIESDRTSFDFIRRREREKALGARATGRDLDEIIGASSQVLSAALSMPLFRAGVYLGQPMLIEKACTAAHRVTNSALRSSGNVEVVLQGCSLLGGARASSDACGEGQQKLRDAYAMLAAEKPADAGRMAADGVLTLRDRCPKVLPPMRTPVDPSSKGFLIVWTLYANEAPPALYLAGEAAPNTADAINETFLRCVQAVRAVAAREP